MYYHSDIKHGFNKFLDCKALSTGHIYVSHSEMIHKIIPLRYVIYFISLSDLNYFYNDDIYVLYHSDTIHIFISLR